MNSLLEFFLLNVPEALVVLMVGLAVFNKSILPKWKQGLLFSFLYGSGSFLLTHLGLSIDVKAFLLLFWMFVLVYWLIERKTWLALVICASSFSLFFISEFFIIIFFQTFSINLDEIMENKHYLYLAVWLYFLFLLIITVILRFLRFDIRRLMPKAKLNRYLTLLILVGSIEFFLILFMSTHFYLAKKNVLPLLYLDHVPILNWAILVLFIVITYLFWVYLSLTIDRVETETETPYLQNINELLTAIRSIKHDAVNHYTAIDGFLKVGMYDMASDYVKQLMRETTNVVQAVDGVKSPAVSALLHSKMAVCMAERIHFSVNIQSESQFSFVKTYDLIKILGNLLDNAIAATLEEVEENRFIVLRWEDTDKERSLYIENSGPTIPTDKLDEVFNLGYTTKGEGEGGVGLAVVKKVVKSYGGRIKVSSNNGITRFSILFPL
ncbi:GHKL domain-containing protein [Brevibacillus humidisoli]|uniref:sensor histidine kinase n=1 Tax=Brevibacillus humidisoli TaxID=2895522 RepID=UPI001E409E0D|nr:ATP-binding protein [Brevibacillus humidisoli]UFJ39996.1 GHKL domain-containing protein [Brevibacillus humidisoli]